MSLIERWKAALEENKNSWRNKIVKEEPIKNNQKILSLQRLQIEKIDQNKEKHLCYLNNENENIIKNKQKIITEELEKDQRLPLSVNNNCQNHVNNILYNNKNLYKFQKPIKDLKSSVNLSSEKKFKNFDTEMDKNLQDKNNVKTKQTVQNLNSKEQDIEEILPNKIIKEKESYFNTNLLLSSKKLALSRPLKTKRLPSCYCSDAKQNKDNINVENSEKNFNDQILNYEKVVLEEKKTKDLILLNNLNIKENNQLNQSFESKNLKKENENKSELIKSNLNLTQNGFQTPIIGLKNCGVKLRQVDTSNLFPNVMLVQFQGSKPINIRLISAQLFYTQQKFSSKFGSYLLITRNRLIIWYSNNVNIHEKSKASQMAYDILANKELLCNATKVEIANDDRLIMLAFKQIVAKITKNDLSETPIINLEKNLNNGLLDNLNNIKFYAEDVIYGVEKIANETKIEKIAEGIPPTTKFFDSSKILIFDFVTEIYVWIGQKVDRSLISAAVKFAEQLKNLPLNQKQCEIFKINKNNNGKRPKWTILLKQSQGIADCLFRFKFEKYFEKLFELHSTIKTSEFNTPVHNHKKLLNERPLSVPVSASFRKITPKLMSNQISSLCSDNAYFGILKDEEKLIEDLTLKLGTKPEPKLLTLQLENVELSVDDKNLFFEELVFYSLGDESNLVMFDNKFFEFEDDKCYVIKWHYRVERQGVSRLNSNKTVIHSTGRQRIAYFIWLGLHSNTKDRSRCALALRNFDHERHEHIRIEQGHEPPMFLQFLEGKMIVLGRKSGWFLIIGSKNNLFSAEELSLPVEFCSQGVYLHYIEENKLHKKSVRCYYGEDSSAECLNGAIKLGRQLALSRQAYFDEKPINLKEITNDQKLSIRCPSNWTGTAPRFYRIFGHEGEEYVFERYDNGINFTFRQSDLKDCVLIEEKDTLWIWSENIVRTFELKVANKIWYDLRQKKIENKAIVINKGYEPIEFCALFPIWNSFKNVNDNSCEEETVLKQPQLLKNLLHERTRFRTPEELRLRTLPKGCDTKHLEQYLNENNFKEIFNCNKQEFNKLPRWKQISLKKKADLF